MKLLPVGRPGQKPIPEVLLRGAVAVAACASTWAGFSVLGWLLPGELPFEWFWVRSLSLALFLVPPWLLLRPASGRTGFGRPELLLLCSGTVVLPFVLIGIGSHMTGPFPQWGVLFWAGALAAAALAEEIEFRGFAQDLFSLRGNRLAGAGISALAFAWVHVDNPSAGLLSTVNIFLFGILLSILRNRTGGLAAPAILHWVWNATTGLVLGFNVSGIELPFLFRPAGRLPWGSFGPEESPVLTICLALVCAAFLLGRGGRRNGTRPDPCRSPGGADQGSGPPAGGAVRDGGDAQDDLPGCQRDARSWFFYPGFPGS